MRTIESLASNILWASYTTLKPYCTDRIPAGC
jgi:hypothetical protein